MAYLNRPSKFFANAAVTPLMCLALAAPAAAQERVNPHGAMVKAFLDRVRAYLDLQKEAADGLPRLTPTEEPSKVEAHKAALKARIRLARPNAQPGDIFGEATAYFKSVIQQDARSRPANDSKAALEEVPKRDPLKVNADYPDDAPVATMPPRILAQLPALPDGLEYRFMGRDLILRDTKANLIADFIDGAVAPVRKDAAPATPR